MSKFKNVFSFFYEKFYYYLLYMAKHPLCSAVMACGILCAFGSYAFATDYYVDSEVVINIASTNYNWLEIGRYGLVFVRKLLGTSWYNPYYTGILFLCFLWLSGMTFSYIAGKMFPKLTPMMSTLGSLIFLTYPTFAEQYYFHFQSAEIAFGLWLFTLFIGSFYLFVRDKRWSCFALTLPLCILIFSIYQSFLPLALCGYLGVFLSLFIQESTSSNAVKYGIAGSIGHFLISFGISQGIDKLFFPASTYLNNQVIWTSGVSFIDACIAVCKSCLRMVIGQGVFYTIILLAAVVCTVFALTYYLKAPLHQLILCLLSTIGIALTPFILTLLMAEKTAIRSQFTYAFSAVILLYFSIQTWFTYGISLKLQRWIALASLLFFTVTQIGTVQYIWKAHEFVTDHDRETSTEILKYMYDSFILKDGIAGTIFWGYLQPESPYQDIISKSPSYLFTSVFNLEHNMEPYCMFSTNRILGYMESMGHRFVYPYQETHFLSSYIMKHENVPAYPAADCFKNNREAYTFNLGNCPESYY